MLFTVSLPLLWLTIPLVFLLPRHKSAPVLNQTSQHAPLLADCSSTDAPRFEGDRVGDSEEIHISSEEPLRDGIKA